MKIQISYLPTETTRALWVQTYILRLFPKAKVKARDGKPPGRVIYITVKEKPAKSPDCSR